MDIRDLPRRPPDTSADVASFAPAVNALSERHRLEKIAVGVLAAVLALVAGCGADVRGSGSEQAQGPPVKATPRTTQKVTPESSVLEVRGGVEASRTEVGGGFVAAKESGGGEAGAADRIEGVRFQIFDDYERLLIDFERRDGERDGEPAGVPRWSIERPPEGGYVRLRFPGVTSTAIADEDFVGSILNQLYVVRDRGGGLFADVFATHAFRYRVTELPESGQLAVDLRGVSEGVELPPTTGDKVVVLQPQEAEEVGSPITVEGYARLFEGQVTVSLLDRDREAISSKKVRANDWTSAWGLFGARFEYSGYEGLATLRVGSRSPKDGSFLGTETEIFLE